MAAHPRSTWFLALIAFIESFIFPIPVDIILIPMILSKRTKAWLYALICTIGSVLGGIFGYLIGLFLYDTVGKYILEIYNLFENYEEFKNLYNKYGIWLVLGGGFSPFPYKVITIASGAFNLNILLFILTSLIARGGRFFLVAGLLWYFGPSVKNIIENHLGKLSIAFFVLLIAGYTLINII